MVAVIGLALFALGTPSPLYSTYRALFSLPPIMVTLVYATYAFGVLTTLLLAGPVSDTVGRRLDRACDRTARDRARCQTTIEGDFVREFTQSPVGSLPPNGQHIVFELTNIFSYDDQGRIEDEYVQTDNRSVLQQLGAKTD